MRHLGALVTTFFLLFALGCGSYLGNAQRAYQDGRYLEVAENLGGHEADVPTLEPAKQASYGYYRGLSLMKLGDHDAASHWLAFAAEIEKQRPGSLLPAQRRELASARDKLAKTVESERVSERESEQTRNEVALPARTASDRQP